MSPEARYGWGSGGAFDERRNSSRVFPVMPDAHRAALRALDGLDKPLRRWIEDGAPNLTHDEHVKRFGEPFRATRAKRSTEKR